MRRLDAAAPLVFVFVCLEAIVSILAHWPYQFTGQGDPDRMARDLVRSGTLLAPPLPLLLLLGTTIFLVRRRDRSGEIANAVMIPICMAMAIGSLGESLAPASPDVPRAIQLSSGLGGAIVFAVLTVVALKALTERRALAPT
jgi:hypothetical protein